MSENTKVAIVTGGSRGIGRAICIKCAQIGYDVAFNYHSNSEAAKSLEKEIMDLGQKCSGSQVDIADFDGVKIWIEKIKEEFGAIDVLVNNAGIVNDKPLMMMSQDQWSSVINTNLNGMFNATRHCIVGFMKQKGGRVINISSISGVIGLPGQTNYSATKGAMNAFTKALAKEVARFNVNVNAIAPGFIETEILSGFTDEQKEELIKNIPLGKMGQVEDVSNLVEFLLSEGAAYITGQIIVTDGGLAIR